MGLDRQEVGLNPLSGSNYLHPLLSLSAVDSVSCLGLHVKNLGAKQCFLKRIDVSKDRCLKGLMFS